jgi:hypothetical protein
MPSRRHVRRRLLVAHVVRDLVREELDLSAITDAYEMTAAVRPMIRG